MGWGGRRGFVTPDLAQCTKGMTGAVFPNFSYRFFLAWDFGKNALFVPFVHCPIATFGLGLPRLEPSEVTSQVNVSATIGLPPSALSEGSGSAPALGHRNDSERTQTRSRLGRLGSPLAPMPACPAISRGPKAPVAPWCRSGWLPQASRRWGDRRRGHGQGGRTQHGMWTDLAHCMGEGSLHPNRKTERLGLALLRCQQLG
jgi:hypothetical protein